MSASLRTVGRWAAVAALCALAPAARGQELPRAPLSSVERVVPSGLRPPGLLQLAVGGGYGYTESVLRRADAHHRLLGALAVEAAPRPWLGVGLRLDGRYDRHTFGDGPADDGWVGDPRLYARGDVALRPDVHVGARLTIWLPGENAPSVAAAATSAEGLALASWAPGAGRTFATANAGYRLDRSARSAPGAHALGPGDRLALAVSDFDALVLGLGLTHARPRWQVFGGWSWDRLVGTAVPAGASPMRLGAGARLAITRAWAAEATAELAVGARPALAPMEPLVPVPPRVTILAGLLARLGEPAPALASPPPPAVEGEPARVAGRLAFDGPAPAELSVTVRAGGRAAEIVPDAEGRFTLADLPPGPAELTAVAPGYEPATVRLDLRPGAAERIELTLRRRLPVGQIRGTVRSFGGRGVDATVRVSATDPADTRPRELRAEGGAFQLDVRPGGYEVVIEAPGYEPQRRTVRVEENGVTVLNVDLRRAR